MNKPHKHAEVIKAWADGAEVEAYYPCRGWRPCGRTMTVFRESLEYRVHDPMRKFKEAYARGENVEVFYKGVWQSVEDIAKRGPYYGHLDIIFCLEVVTKNPLRIAPKHDYKHLGQAYVNGSRILVFVTFDGATNEPKAVELAK